MTAPPRPAAPSTPTPDRDEDSTLRGAAFMVFAMASFAVEDALIKTLGGKFPAPQIIWILGLGGAAALILMMRLRGEPLWTPEMRGLPAWRRTLFEIFGTLCFVSALVAIPLATASAVIQATPLVVAMGAALFLGSKVGWRRWAAILVGFCGVLLILRPGSESFDPAALLAVGGMLGLASRDLATRSLPRSLTSTRLSLMAFGALVPAGILLQLVQGMPFVRPSGSDALILAIAVVVGLIAYLAIVGATRQGDIAVVSSFRYSRMLFALILAMVFFGERPDTLMLLGIAIIIGAGLYTLIREARLARGRG